MSDNYFKELNVPTENTAKIIQEFLPSTEWHWIPYVTVCKNIEEIEDQFYKSCGFLSCMRQELEPTLALYKFPSSSFYEWHKDIYIGASINMVLKDYDSITLFSEDTDKIEIYKTTRLPYQPLTWYAFNSQERHCVINHGDEDRILLTVTFTRDYSYPELLRWYESMMI